jgi:hypothetical protein
MSYRSSRAHTPAGPSATHATDHLFLLIARLSLLWLLLLLSLVHLRAPIPACSRSQCGGLPFEVGCFREKLIAIALETSFVRTIDCGGETVGAHCGIPGSSCMLKKFRSTGHLLLR